MRTIVAGSRCFTNLALMTKAIAASGFQVTTVVSGKAPGADLLGEQWAKARGIPVDPHPADWKQYGRSAGPIRNKEMAENAEALIALWDSESPGTKNMIETAKWMGLKVYVQMPVDDPDVQSIGAHYNTDRRFG